MTWMHRLSEVNPETYSGVCSVCGPVKVAKRGVKPSGEPSGWQCGVRLNEYRKRKGFDRKWQHPSPVRGKREELMEQQEGKCAICGNPPEGKALAVDHDHRCCPSADIRKCCGSCVRGLLCSPCNTGLGMFDENVDRLRAAVAYLERFMD